MLAVATLALLEMVLNQQISSQEIQHHRLHVAPGPTAVSGEEGKAGLVINSTSWGAGVIHSQDFYDLNKEKTLIKKLEAAPSNL